MSARYIAVSDLAAIVGKNRTTVSRTVSKAVADEAIAAPITHRRAKYVALSDAQALFPDVDASAWADATTIDHATATRPMVRLWLTVPFDEKDEVKRLGARWDASERRWFAPVDRSEALAKWLDSDPLPAEFPGEDRTFGGGLAHDPIPSTARYNVRTCVSPRDWLRIGYAVRDRAGNACEFCGDTEQRLHVHERFEFDDTTSVQTLRRLVACCELCHAAAHAGNTDARTGHALHEAEQHMRRVLGIEHAEMQQRRLAADILNGKRSRQRWALDLSMLEAVGIETHIPDRAATPAPEAAAAPTEAPAPTEPDVEPQLDDTAVLEQVPASPGPVADEDVDDASIDPDELQDAEPWLESAIADDELDDLIDDEDSAGEPLADEPPTPSPAIATQDTVAITTSTPVDDVDEDEDSDEPLFPWDAPSDKAPDAAHAPLEDEQPTTAIAVAAPPARTRPALRARITGDELRSAIEYARRPLRDRLRRRR